MILTLSHKRSFVECGRWKFGPSGLYIQCIYVKCGKYMYGWISQTGSQICQTVSLIISWRRCITEQKFGNKTKVRSTKQEVESWKRCIVEQNVWKFGPPGLCNELIYTKYGPKCQTGSWPYFGPLSYSAYLRQNPVPGNCRESCWKCWQYFRIWRMNSQWDCD